MNLRVFKKCFSLLIQNIWTISYVYVSWDFANTDCCLLNANKEEVWYCWGALKNVYWSLRPKSKKVFMVSLWLLASNIFDISLKLPYVYHSDYLNIYWKSHQHDIIVIWYFPKSSLEIAANYFNTFLGNSQLPLRATKLRRVQLSSV